MVIFVILASLLFPEYSNAERIRRVVLAKDQIAKVQTAIGVATIIQVPDQPTSLVVGNQEGFKVEFLDTAITVKPLHASAKSNLYIYTDYRRFDVQLLTAQESTADYVVYLEEKKASKSNVRTSTIWKSSRLSADGGEFKLSLRRIGRLGKSVFFDIEITSRKSFEIKPEWFWVTQGKKMVPIQRLVLSAFRGNQNTPIRAVVEILNHEFNVTMPVRLELRARKPLSVEISKGDL